MIHGFLNKSTRNVLSQSMHDKSPKKFYILLLFGNDFLGIFYYLYCINQANTMVGGCNIHKCNQLMKLSNGPVKEHKRTKEPHIYQVGETMRIE